MLNWVYDAIAQKGIRQAFKIGSRYSEKIEAIQSLRDRELPDLNLKDQPILIHASSGEYEYAKPVIAELKAKHPDIPIVCSYYSTSVSYTHLTLPTRS